jgi:predicted DNA repair protein MutK
MFLVGGGILTHGVPALHHAIEGAARAAAAWPAGPLLAVLLPGILDAVVGVIAGALVLLAVSGVSKWRHAS